jgi:hypothetical protein
MASLGPDVNREIIRLKQLAVKYFASNDWVELGMLLDQEELINTNRLLRALHFGDDDYESCALSVLRKMAQTDPANLEVITEFIEARSLESGDYVSSHASEGRRLVFTPLVFRIPDVPLAPDLVSVMMPINAGTTKTYEAIKAAVQAAGLTCKRADDIWVESTVIQDIFNLIYSSYIVICDFSGRNPNVFYEAGIAHTLGKHVIPITQSNDDIPFDLRHHRYLSYLNNDEGRANLSVELEKRLRTLVSQNANR